MKKDISDERLPDLAWTFLPVQLVSPVAERTGGLIAPHRVTAHWHTGPSLSCLLRPHISPGLSPGLTPSPPELEQPPELLLVERVQTWAVEGWRVKFVADVTVVLLRSQVTGHTAGGGAASWSCDRPLTHHHCHHHQHQALYSQHCTLSLIHTELYYYSCVPLTNVH